MTDNADSILLREAFGLVESGVAQSLDELGAICQRHGVLMYSDTTASLAGNTFETDAWGLDFILTGSQKSFALPPGLAFGAAQLNVLERANRPSITGRLEWLRARGPRSEFGDTFPVAARAAAAALCPPWRPT